jgi:spermidine synthase
VLPLLFEKEPKTALFMCFGSGITCGMLAQGPFERIDAVEIAEDVLKTAPLFEVDNLGVVENDAVNFVVDDGRNFLLTTRNRYDVITFEPMPLALAGVSTFYTQEYYRLCLEHLTPGGLVSQWVPIHSLSPDLVRSLTHTFTTVFPEYCAWFINSDLFLIGSNEPLHVDYAQAVERVSEPGIQSALEKVNLADPAELLTCFFMGKQNAAAYAEGGALVTDDRPWAEFVAPKLVYQRTEAETLAELKSFYESPLTVVRMGDEASVESEAARQALERRSAARVHNLEGLILLYGGLIGGGQEDPFKKAVAVEPQDYTARYYLRQIATQRVSLFIRWEQFEEAEAYLAELIELVPDLPDFHLLLGDCLFAQEKTEPAGMAYRRHLSLGGSAPRAGERSGPGS